ncbi:soluble lytic murein transglycosylase precursor [Oxobacter pfennigii]|uniref:Soluble lytic murein transglycosylase n=1 Tax=Oxobacter pfennigii TaxID=36849 RepID=A0A0P8WK89_9CLOT|nr:transglycosylase SLT domain-containing protein [Oxobacter pfennigii]KPU42677.1 soluble lytic murein transglycosylase precursor [Oxobacter pfennigii]
MNKRIGSIIVFSIIVIACAVMVFKFTDLIKGNRGYNSIAEQVNKDLDYYVKLVEKRPDSINQKEKNQLIEVCDRKDALGYMANLALAEYCIVKGGDPSDYYFKALSLYETSEIKKKLAFSMINQRQDSDAAVILADLLPDESAMESIHRLKIDPAAMGQIMLEAKKWKPACEYLKMHIDEAYDEEGKNGLEILYARALTESGDYKQGLLQFEELKAANKLNSEHLYFYGRCLDMTGKTEEAKEIYSSVGVIGAYYLGNILEKEGNLNAAAESFSGSEDPASLWKGATLWETLGEDDKAYEIYTKIASKTGSFKDDAAFRAYILSVRNKNEDYSMLEIISQSPAWMERMDRDTVWMDLQEIDYEQPEFLKNVQWYTANNKENMADIEMYIGQNNASPGDKLALSYWYLEKRNYSESVRWAASALKEMPDLNAYKLSYPKHYEEEVLKASEEFSVDPYLLWAVMREESRYMYNAISRVGAMGLLQIMPSTGKDIAARLKVNTDEIDLSNPMINIRFGAYYLKSMLDRYNGDEDKALAAYNGGAGNVNRWAKTKLGNTKEDFPAAVAFSETREYITRVKNSYLTYKWIYEEKSR